MATGLMHGGLEAAAARFPDHPAVLAGQDRWTFADLERASNALARHLGAEGVGVGDRVAVMTSNRPEFVVVVHAVSKVGAAPVLLNPAWKAFEVDTAVRLTAPSYGAGDGGGTALLVEHLGAARVLDLDAAPAAALVDRSCDIPAPPVAAGPDDDAALVFSSGTTDLPKAVRHTHRSLRLATAHWCT
ncbi:MAG TPA: AMP-binding protein, partial [Acidimicrobiales bacterium]|nr:AMP-binding protein [Acidimicrobiales bacterium]